MSVKVALFSYNYYDYNLIDTVNDFCKDKKGDRHQVSIYDCWLCDKR